MKTKLSALIITFLYVFPATPSFGESLDSYLGKLDQLGEQCDKMRSDAENQAKNMDVGAVNETRAPAYAKERTFSAISQAEVLPSTLRNLADRGSALIVQAAKETNSDRQQAILTEIQAVVQAGQQLNQVKIQLNANLDELKALAEAGREAENSANDQHATARADSGWSTDIGGGVFINVPAVVQGLERNDVIRAAYDVASKRFLFYTRTKTLGIPFEDAETVAILIKCFSEPGPRNEISVSLGIDPIDNGRMPTGGIGIGMLTPTEKPLWGCRHLKDTIVGWRILNAEKMIWNLWRGLDSSGKDLTKILAYPSLMQIAFDHRAAKEQKKFSQDRFVDWRIWIRPGDIKIKAKRESQLDLEPITFQMFSETLELLSKKEFRGKVVANPGADVYTSNFNGQFEKFVNAPLGTEEDSGRVIRPLQELRPIATAASILLWVRGKGFSTQQGAIPMNTGWASDYPIRKVPTVDAVPILPVDVDTLPPGPIVVYDENGPSRVINKDDRTILRIFYENGKIQHLEVSKTSIPINVHH